MKNLLKKSLAALLALLMVLSMAQFAVFAGDDGTEPPAQTDGHDGDCEFNEAPDIAAVSPTCTEPGHGSGWTCTKAGCNRGKNGTPYIMWNKGEETIPALGHAGELIPAVEPKCEKPGNSEYYKCSRCGKLGNDKACTVETTAEAHKLAALEHVWSEWKTTKTAKTCKEKSEQERTCSLCGKIELRKIDTVNHTPKDVAAVAATCETAGHTAGKICSVCGETIEGNEAIKPLGHDWDEGKTTKATCVTAGKTTYTCKRKGCGKTQDDNVTDPLGHQYVDDPEVPATCQKKGKTAGRHCERCGEVFIEQKDIDPIDHDWEITPAVAPTCTEPGKTEGKKCKVCGLVGSVSEDKPAKGHSFTTEVITPVTCEANGLTKKYCTVCGYSETQVDLAKGHALSDWIYEENFSCETGGERHKVCTNCGEIFQSEQLPPQGHDWSKEWTIDTQPTCTTKGYKSHHCTRCGKKNDITTMAKLPHTYLDNGTKATLKRDGLITGVCLVCGTERKPLTVKRVKTVQLSKTSYVYDGKAKKPTVIVKDAVGKKLQKDTDYKVTYASGRKKVGAYVVKITLIGNYSGTKKLKFSIKLGTPKGLEAKTNSAKQTVKLSCAALKGAQKYVFYYSTEKDGGYKKLAVAKKPTAVIKTLEPGTYFFKVRALTADKNGKNAYSAYSAPIKVKLAKAK